ncbi:hypothetical protein HK096_004299, partial [Nowakowskiella sp. JEL0078]
RFTGYLPSAYYLQAMYVKFIHEHHKHIDQKMSLVDSKFLKVDDTFQVTKHIAKLKGTSVFSSLCTILNDFEEIHLQLWKPTKSLTHLVNPLCAMNESIELYGLLPPKILFTDNVNGECTFYESAFPSLKKDISPVENSDFQHL